MATPVSISVCIELRRDVRANYASLIYHGFSRHMETRQRISNIIVERFRKIE